MLLRLELRLEISIKYNLSITFAPKNIVSPRLTFSLVFFYFLLLFLFIYFVLSSNFCRFLMSFALASLFLNRFMGGFFMLRSRIIPSPVLCRDFRLLKIWNVFFVFARNRQSHCPKKRKLINAKVHWQVSNFAYIEYEVSISQIFNCLRRGNKRKVKKISLSNIYPALLMKKRFSSYSKSDEFSTGYEIWKKTL